ncbi:hypothetical protein IKG68_01210 [Candidatus Saccharibacteria bacterium]|nr:hypothetical protein [Candidatus Saccharibacteria bacterium]
MAQAAKKKKATSAHRKVQSSTTRSRKNVKQTVNKTTSKKTTGKKQSTKIEKIISQQSETIAQQSIVKDESAINPKDGDTRSTSQMTSIAVRTAADTEQATESEEQVRQSVAVAEEILPVEQSTVTEQDLALKQDTNNEQQTADCTSEQASETDNDKATPQQDLQKIIPAPVIDNKSPEIILHTSKRTDLLEEKIEQAAEQITINTKKETVVPAPRDTITEEIHRNEKNVEDVLQEVIERQEEVADKASTRQKKKTARGIKDSAIEKALVEASSERTRHEKNRKNSRRTHFGFRRIVLALACAAAAVFAIVYFVNLNTPNVSLKVAAMQSGIDAKYPGYVPRDYNLSDITSESGKITLNFRNPSTGDAFTLIEEKSSWDSSALLNNFVRSNYGEDFSQVEEQGLTLFINGSDACWVNGGVVYKLRTTSGSLTKKQIKTIATSL